MKASFTVFFVCLQFVLLPQNPESEISGNWINFHQFSTTDPDQDSPITCLSIFNVDAACIQCRIAEIQRWQSLTSILTQRDFNTPVLLECPDLSYLTLKVSQFSMSNTSLLLLK